MVVYTGLSSAVLINLEAGTARLGGGSDDLLNIENVYASAHDDIVYGNNSHGNRLYGSFGNDTLYGLAGEDVLIGGGQKTIFMEGLIMIACWAEMAMIY